MTKRFYGAFIIVSLILIVFGCQKEYNYETEAHAQVNSGIRHDSLFMGLHFGMHRKDFRERCAALNQRGIFQQGSNGLSVEYQLTTLSSRVLMNFYPAYDKDVIVEMPVDFEFMNWAPWNKQSYSDSLLEEVGRMFEEWYDAEFHVVTIHSGRKILVFVEGNRRIILMLNGDRMVRALFSDLSVVPYQLDAIHLD